MQRFKYLKSTDFYYYFFTCDFLMKRVVDSDYDGEDTGVRD